MENTLLVGLSRQMVLARELDVVANNVANLNTTGYKADNSMFEQFMMPVARENRFNTSDRQMRFVNDRATWHDLRPGSIQKTGSPLDVAIDGAAFFAVQTAAGERYTRNGSFQINAQGQLVTSDGSFSHHRAFVFAHEPSGCCKFINLSATCCLQFTLRPSFVSSRSTS